MNKPVEKLAKEEAFEWAIDYKPWEEDLGFKAYAEYGYEQGYLSGYEKCLLSRAELRKNSFRDGMKHGYSQSQKMLNIKVLGPTVQMIEKEDPPISDVFVFLVDRIKEYSNYLIELEKQIGDGST